jgi:hypothetical protein
MDGTSVKTQDTPETRRILRAQVFESGKESSYPQVRIVTLLYLPTRILAGASFGNYITNEMRLAPEVIAQIPDRSVTVFDKGFFSAELLLGLTERGESRHFIIPARADLTWEVISGSSEDALVRKPVPKKARINAPDLPLDWNMRVVLVHDLEGNPSYLLTSLLDQQLFPAAEVGALYARRWEVETSYLELKVRLFLKSLTLRSLTLEGINQEIWGAFIAYNMVRIRMDEVARQWAVSPLAMSFKDALDLFKDELIAEAVAPGASEIAGGLIQRRKEQLVRSLNQRREGRRFPRVVKSRPSKYDIRYVYSSPEKNFQSKVPLGNRNKKKKQRHLRLCSS